MKIVLDEKKGKISITMEKEFVQKINMGIKEIRNLVADMDKLTAKEKHQIMGEAIKHAAKVKGNKHKDSKKPNGNNPDSNKL